MFLAAVYKHEDIVNLIAGLDNYDPTIRDSSDSTDFHILCELGYTEPAKTLFEKHPDFDINRPNKSGLTCMRLAINNHRKDLVNFIAGIDKYNPMIPDIDASNDMYALCSMGYTDAIKIYCEKHPDINLSFNMNNRYFSYMQTAINHKNKDLVNFIAGMDNYDPTIPDRNGFTDIHCLCQEKYTDEAIALLEKKRDFNINQRTLTGATCMSFAISNEDKNLVDYIATRDDYDPTITGSNGWTDFHSLCRAGYTIVDYLFAKHPNFDINQKAGFGYTCLSLARDFGHYDIAKIIFKYFPSVDVSSINKH